MEPSALVHRVERKLLEALWMAIEALGHEADVLRALGGEGALEYAEEAERQAALLRRFARIHAVDVEDHPEIGEASDEGA